MDPRLSLAPSAAGGPEPLALARGEPGRPVRVRTGPDGVPDAVWLRGGWVAVQAVANCWRVETGWWRSEPDAAVARDVYRVGLADGRCADLAKDRLRGGWRCLRTWG